MARLTQSYVHGTSDTQLIGQTVGAFFDAVAARWAKSEALIVRHQQVRWTYEALKRKVDDFAAGLLSLGLRPGDRVGIWSPNNAEWVITQFATAKAGLILVNINPAYRLAEADYALNKVECKALVTASQFKTSDYVGMLSQLLAEKLVGRFVHGGRTEGVGHAVLECGSAAERREPALVAGAERQQALQLLIEHGQSRQVLIGLGTRITHRFSLSKRRARRPKPHGVLPAGREVAAARCRERLGEVILRRRSSGRVFESGVPGDGLARPGLGVDDVEGPDVHG